MVACFRSDQGLDQRMFLVPLQRSWVIVMAAAPEWEV